MMKNPPLSSCAKNVIDFSEDSQNGAQEHARATMHMRAEAEAYNNRWEKWLIPELVFMFFTSSHVLLLHFRQGNYFWYFPGMCRNNFTTVSATTVLPCCLSTALHLA